MARFRPIPLSLLTALLTALYGASCTPPASRGAPCNDDGECGAGQVCAQGSCVDGAPLGGPLDAGSSRLDASAISLDAGPDVSAVLDAGAVDVPPPSDDDAGQGRDASAPAPDVEQDAGDDAGHDAGVVCPGPDEDGDGVADPCDNCPSVANALQEDLLEAAKGLAPDGVGDACDPRATEPGDSLLFFEGFNDDSAPTWQSLSCTWTVADGRVAQSEGQGAKNCRLSFPAVTAPDVVVETGVHLLTFDHASFANAGVMLSSVDLQGWLCSGSVDDVLAIYRVNNGTANQRGRTPMSFAPGDEYTLRVGGSDRQMLCHAKDGVVYYNVRALRPAGAVALRTNDATASFAYVTVYKVGGDIAPPLPGEPRHRYSFAEAPDDVSANDSQAGAHGEYKGTVSKDGSAVVIDGSSDGYVDLPNGIVSSLEAVTVEAWVTWDGSAAGYWQHLWDFGTSTAGELTDVEAADAGSYTGTGVPTLIFVPETGEQQSYTRLRNAAGDDVFVMTAEALPSGRPAHVVVSYDPAAGEAVLYIDGGERRRASGTMPLSELDDVNNWVGRSGWSNDGRFDGAVDELRLYGRALSPLEVLGSFQAGPDADL